MLGRCLTLGRSEWAMLFEAMCYLALGRLVILVLPFRWFAPRLGRYMAISEEGASRHDAASIHRIAWAIGAVGSRVPWDAKCLVRAYAAKWMLTARGVSGTIYLGMAKDLRGGLKAHAWLQVGDQVVTGDVGRRAFTTVATFAFEGRGSRKSEQGVYRIM